MKTKIRNIAKQVVPKPILIHAWDSYCEFKARKAKQVFEAAPDTPAWLDWDALETLQAAYPPFEWTYHYDLQTLKKRGQARMQEMLRLVRHEKQPLTRFLDLGSWDGTTCHMLQQLGKTAVGIDVRAEGLTEEVRLDQVPFSQMDASHLGFADNSFDFLFSYNSFEHFPEPERVLQEALRVLRPGGYLYVNFGPLYFSAKGAHLFRTINVPYCQFLFPKPLLVAFTKAKGIPLKEFHWMNEWKLAQYRDLWRTYSSQMETVVYYETHNADHLELITRYPSCFKSKVDSFDELLVAYIEGLFRKVG